MEFWGWFFTGLIFGVIIGMSVSGMMGGNQIGSAKSKKDIIANEFQRWVGEERKKPV